MKRIILDVDTGIDDAWAIIYAMKAKDIQIEGITTGYGNVHANLATENTLKVMKLVDSTHEIPVYQGAEKPLIRSMFPPVTHIHGENGLGEAELPEAKMKAQAEYAVDFIVDTVNNHPGEITLVFVGRQTNLALALAKDPSIVEKVKEVIFMGGAVGVHGNAGPFTEGNISGDPDAAKNVFEAGFPITMVGLDVTYDAGFTREDLAVLSEKLQANGQNELASFISTIVEFGILSSEQLKEGSHRLLHDPLGIGVLRTPDLVEMKNLKVDVETKGALTDGMTVAEFRPSEMGKDENVQVCFNLDKEAFITDFIETIASK